MKEARTGNEIAQDTSQRQLRAYLMAEDFMLTGFWNGGPAVMQLKIFNRGQTPAYDVRMWSIITANSGNPDLAKIKRMEPPHISATVIGPGNYVVHGNGCLGPLDGNAYLAVAHGLNMVFAGVITYRDAFGRRRITSFKQYYAGNGNLAATGGDLTACGKGNLSS